MRGKARSVVLLGGLSLAAALTACAGSSSNQAVRAPAPSTAWAVKVDRPGLPNLHKVTDQLYRGAQPTEEGFAQLRALGIKSVVNLRTFHSDAAHCQRHGLRCFQIHEKAWHPEDEDTIEFLRLGPCLCIANTGRIGPERASRLTESSCRDGARRRPSRK